MRLLKSLFCSLFILVITPSVIFANELPSPQSSLVATVNIVDASIISQDNNVFAITFDLSNREGLQTGVMYGVRLLSGDGKSLVDEKVYEEKLTLYEHSTVTKTINYTAPSTLSGEYVLLLVSNNQSNFPFGIASLGKVKLSASTQGFEIVNNSCYITVEEEGDGQRYSLIENVDVAANETLRLTCGVINHSNHSLSLLPVYETRYHSSYGPIVSEVTGGENKTFTFNPGKTENFSLLLPKGTSPQFYSLKIAFGNENVRSNNVYVNYVVQGLSATLTKVSLDRDVYKRGEKGTLSVLWSASLGNFARSDTAASSVPQIMLEVSMVGENKVACIEPINQALTKNTGGPQTLIPFQIKAQCTNPRVLASLRDETGNVLDQKEFTFATASEKSTKLPTAAIVVIALAVLLVIGTKVYINKKEVTNLNS